MANDRGLTIGFPRMYNEPGERRAFLPSLDRLLADLGVEVFVEAGAGPAMGYADDALPGASRPRAHRRRGDGLRPGHRRGAAGARGPLPAAPARLDPPLDAPLRDPAGARRAAARPGHRGRRARHGHRRRRPAARPEPARRGAQRSGRGLRRPRAPLAAALSPHRDADQRHDPGRGRGRQARHRVGGQGRRRRAQRALHARGPAGRRGRRRRAEPVGQRGLLPASPGARPTSSSMPPRAATRRGRCSPTPGSASCPSTRSSATSPSIPTCSTTTRRSCAASRASPRAASTSGSSARTTPPGTACPRRSRRRTGGPSCPATRGRASDPRPAWRLYGSQLTPLLKTLIWYGGLPAIGPDVSFHGRALWRGSLRHWLSQDPVA